MKFLDWLLRFAPWLQPVIGISALVVSGLGPIPGDAYGNFMGEDPQFLENFAAHQRMEERLEGGGYLWEFVTSLVAAATERWWHFLLTLGLVILLAWVVQWRRATGPAAPRDVTGRPFYERQREHSRRPRLAYWSMLAILLAFSGCFLLALKGRYALPKSLDSIADHLQCPKEFQNGGSLADDTARALYSQLHGVTPGEQRGASPDLEQIAAAEDYFESLARITVWSLLGLISVYGAISRLHRENSASAFGAGVVVLLLVTAAIQTAQWFGLADAFGRLKLGTRVLRAAAIDYGKRCSQATVKCSRRWPFLPPPRDDKETDQPLWYLHQKQQETIFLSWLWPLDRHQVEFCLAPQGEKLKCHQAQPQGCVEGNGTQFAIDSLTVRTLLGWVPHAPARLESGIIVKAALDVEIGVDKWRRGYYEEFTVFP